MLYCVHSCSPKSVCEYLDVLAGWGHTTHVLPPNITSARSVFAWYTSIYNKSAESHKDIFVQGSPLGWVGPDAYEDTTGAGYDEAAALYDSGHCIFILLNDTPSSATKSTGFTRRDAHAVFYFLWRMHIERRKSGKQAYVL